MRINIIILALLMLASCKGIGKKVDNPPFPESDLRFTELSKSWDEGIPLGNGIMGALIWEKDKRLRISLDRADLWDLRPMENLDKPEWKYSWVQEQWQKDSYSKVQQMFDLPYDRNPAPSKIPGGAMEFDIAALGEIESVELSLKNAMCTIKWKNGATLQTFVNATDPIGWFRFSGADPAMVPGLIPPAYILEGESEAENPVSGQDLRRLGYSKGELNKGENSITYNQKGWGGFKYQISVRWEKESSNLEGCWSINSEFPGWEKQLLAESQTESAMNDGFDSQFEAHQNWWNDFWSQSWISLPDTLLNKQWYLEMYKMGAATGNGPLLYPYRRYGQPIMVNYHPGKATSTTTLIHNSATGPLTAQTE